MGAEMTERISPMPREFLDRVRMPVRVVPPSAVSELFRRQGEEEEILFARLCAISIVGAIPRAIVKAPFIMIHVVVPLAS